MTSRPLRAQTDSPALFVSASEVEAFGFARAVDAIEAALRSGLDPTTDPPRFGTAVGDRSSLLFMPSIAAADAVGVKLVTTNPDNPATGLPFVHGIYVMFDRPAEIEPALCSRAVVVVEDVATALRECGEIVQASRAGTLAPGTVGVGRRCRQRRPPNHPWPAGAVQGCRYGMGGPRRRSGNPAQREDLKHASSG